jgi:hypothetical protein
MHWFTDGKQSANLSLSIDAPRCDLMNRNVAVPMYQNHKQTQTHANGSAMLDRSQNSQNQAVMLEENNFSSPTHVR